MCIRNNLKIVGVVLLHLLAASFVFGQNYQVSIGDLDGTWVENPGHLHSKSIIEQVFGWGFGKVIPETSLNIDLEKKEFQIPGGGLWVIEKVTNINTSDVQIVVVNNDIPYDEYPANKKPRITLRFSFVNHDKFKITSQVYNIDLGGSDPYLTDGGFYYRLSGRQ